MIILSIETSCDETAVSLVRAEGGLESPNFTVLGNALYSQAMLHAAYGGVYPNLAKREHAKNLVPLLKQALSHAFGNTPRHSALDTESMNAGFPLKAGMTEKITEILNKEHGLAEELLPILDTHTKPAGDEQIDMIAVTSGPGLEPALWVGISFAKALALAWDVPLMPTNHMKGHITSVLLNGKKKVQFPTLALLVSGGHTEIVLMSNWNTYETIGQTRDDAVGEAFDKVARMLELPYPGGPEISRLAQIAREKNLPIDITLPRPMLHSNDLDMSFSGLKTSVLYLLRDLRGNTTEITDGLKAQIAREFEDTVTEVLITKIVKALEETGATTLIIGGGVIANTYIRQAFEKLVQEKYNYLSLFIPDKSLATDNAIMIACAAYIDHLSGKKPEKDFRAEGNLKLA
jgi:N6-L-threonylcarbamoyladenine synthase